MSKLSEDKVRYEIVEFKRCLLENGFDVTSFSFPYNDGDNNKKILKAVADNYYITLTPSEPLMLFECSNEQEKGFIDYNNRYENECHYSTKNNEDEYFKRYTITGLIH